MPLLDFIPIGAEEAWLVPAAPLAAFAIMALGAHRSRLLAPLLSVLAIAFAVLAAIGVLGDYLDQGAQTFDITWLRAGDDSLTVGYQVDALSTMMLVLVTSVSLAVQVYSLEYMKGEPRLGWYFAAHSLFAASMLGLVLTESLLLLYITWELVGFCSYLLIGFWYDRRSAAEAAKKAFITTRIGDVGLLIGIILVYLSTDTFAIQAVFNALPDLPEAVIALAAFLIFLGAMGKSAQAPLHVWLPDAMEGPTPVSALIHAATMVAAGVFLVARLFPLFAAAPAILWVVAIIGAVTALLAGILALSEIDFKRILAYSTVSQLGLMMLALGMRGVESGLFHLLTHGYFKALLFLIAGAALHAIGRHAASIYQVRGMWRQAPFLTISLGIGALALAGLPPFSGFFSKEGILAAPLDVGGIGGAVLFIAAMAASFLSTLYMARLFLVIALGSPEGDAEHLHEPPPAMSIPLLVLTVLAAVAGAALAREIGPFLGGGVYHLEIPLATVSTLIGVGGLAMGWAIYSRRERAPVGLVRWLGPLPRWAGSGFYFDRAYQATIDKIALAGAVVLAFFDRRIVNDIGVNGTGALTILFGALLRLIQTGRVYNYALGFTVGTVVLAAVATLF